MAFSSHTVNLSSNNRLLGNLSLYDNDDTIVAIITIRWRYAFLESRAETLKLFPFNFESLRQQEPWFAEEQ